MRILYAHACAHIEVDVWMRKHKLVDDLDYIELELNIQTQAEHVQRLGKPKPSRDVVV